MNDRKKILKEQYKQMKPAMGVFVVRNIQNQRIFLEASVDIMSMFNRIRFQLSMGMHPNQALQKDWKALGETQFVFEKIDQLEYSKDESKTDYRDDLQTLKSIWIEKLKEESNALFY